MSVDDAIKIAQMVGWGPVALILAVVSAAGYFVFRERDVTRTVRIQYLEHELKDCKDENPSAAIARLRETLKINEEERIHLKEEGDQATKHYEAEIRRITAEKTEAQARNAMLESIRIEKGQEDATRAQKFDELQGERDAALLEAATLRQQLARASRNLSEFTGPHSGHYDDQIANEVLRSLQERWFLFLHIRTGYPQFPAELEEQRKHQRLLEEAAENGSLVLVVYRDGMSKMSIVVETATGEVAGWLTCPDRVWYWNDYYKTLLAILESEGMVWLPATAVTQQRGRLAVSNITFRGTMPTDSMVSVIHVSLESDGPAIRLRAQTIIDRIR